MVKEPKLRERVKLVPVTHNLVWGVMVKVTLLMDVRITLLWEETYLHTIILSSKEEGNTAGRIGSIETCRVFVKIS